MISDLPRRHPTAPGGNRRPTTLDTAGSDHLARHFRATAFPRLWLLLVLVSALLLALSALVPMARGGMDAAAGPTPGPRQPLSP